jgi:hypothetical protein
MKLQPSDRLNLRTHEPGKETMSSERGHLMNYVNMSRIMKVFSKHPSIYINGRMPRICSQSTLDFTEPALVRNRLSSRNHATFVDMLHARRVFSRPWGGLVDA